MNNSLPPLTPKVVLGIAAHPDDLDFGAAGTMAAFANAGADIHYLILTDGSKGSSDVEMSPPTLVKTREAEQRAAVEILGGKDVTFLGYPDGELEVTMQLKKDVVKVIRTVKPDVVVTMDPSMIYSADRGFINHPDHRAAGQTALDAVYPLARDHLSFPELFADGFAPHITPTVLLINFDKGNYTVDISDTFDKKIAALKAHASQIPDLESTEGWMRSLAETIGASAGYGLGESFVRIDVR
ncbi:MAG TPA: PIG-L deacetylase family protein [Candidatus Saccharimonadales bacterium]|nr:PIG-L deacetylase family protein [Candidatus Saccharimonadales bacterium]